MPFFVQGHSPTTSAPAFATVLRDMLFQPCNGHRHPHRQLPLFRRLQSAEPHQPPHPVPRLDELAFEPSMFRTTYRQACSRIHLAPVENRERQITTKAKQKQILFSPYIRLNWLSQNDVEVYSASPSRRRSSSCQPASSIMARSVPIGKVALSE